MEDIFNFLTTCLVCAWILRLWHDRHSILLGLKIPSYKLQLLFGFGKLFTPQGCLRYMSETKQKLGKNYLIYVGPFPVFFSTDPITLKEILTSKQCIQKDQTFYGNIRSSLGDGFITSSEPDWSHERKLLNVSFNNKYLMSFLPIFQEEINDLIKTIDREIENTTKTPLIDYFRKFTIEIAARTTTGRDLRKTQFTGKGVDHIREALEYVSTVALNFIYFIGLIRVVAKKTYFRKSINALGVLQSFVADSLKGTAARNDVNIRTALDYVRDAMQQNKINFERAGYNMIHLFAGAFETTSTSIYLTIILLAMHPECQQRVYEEIYQLYVDHDEENFEITYENINQMVYLHMVIREMMRLFPVVPMVARKVTGGDLELSNGITLPQGQSVMIDIFNLHRCKDIWGPQADKFNPDNFLPSNIEEKHPYAYIPFTKGNRFCIGWRYGELSMMVALTKLINRYKFSTTAKIEDLRFENHISLHVKPDPPILVERRQKVA